MGERDARERQATLFNGLRFFLGREIPREPLVFMIRAVGGEVSWDNSVALGATYPSTDPRITHQLVDRDPTTMGELVLGRFYVQPQWVFDSINRREICPEKDYALGETLPPHLSPFIQERRLGDYVPPEQLALEGEKAEEEEEEEENEELEEEDETDNEAEDESTKMGVRVGVMDKLDDDHDTKMQEDEEYKLRVMMIKKKHRGLYRSMMKNRRKRMNESKLKERKRKEWDEKNGPKPKKNKLEENPPVSAVAA